MQHLPPASQAPYHTSLLSLQGMGIQTLSHSITLANTGPVTAGSARLALIMAGPETWIVGLLVTIGSTT